MSLAGINTFAPWGGVLTVTDEQPVQMPVWSVGYTQPNDTSAFYIDNANNNGPIFVCFGQDQATIANVQSGSIRISAGDVMLFENAIGGFVWVSIKQLRAPVNIVCGYVKTLILFGSPLFPNQKIYGLQS